MDREVVFTQLRKEFEDGNVTKKTIKEATVFWNEAHEDKIVDCMCRKIARKIYAKMYLEWYEEQDR